MLSGMQAPGIRIRQRGALARCKGYALGVAVLAAWPIPGLASLRSPKDLGGLSSDANAVVVATNAERSGQRVSLVVTRSLKGSVAPGPHVATWPGAPGGAQALNGAALWFLVGAGGGWQVLPFFTGQPFSLVDVAIPIPDGELSPEESYADADPIEDKLVVELRRGLLSGDGDLASAAADALKSLVAGPEPLTRDRPHQHHSDGLTGHPERGALARLERDWAATLLDVVQDLSSRGERIGAGLIVSVGSIVEPSAATQIQALLQSVDDDAFLKKALAEALRNIHTREALPGLVALLAEQDPGLQYIGVMGLSSFAMGCPPGLFCAPPQGGGPYTTPAVELHSPARDLFLQDPARYISFWQRWWKELQRSP